MTSTSTLAVNGAVGVTGNLTATAGGAITQTAALTVGGTSALNAGGNAITLTNAGNTLTGAISFNGTSGSVVQLTNAAAGA